MKLFANKRAMGFDRSLIFISPHCYSTYCTVQPLETLFDKRRGEIYSCATTHCDLKSIDTAYFSFTLHWFSLLAGIRLKLPSCQSLCGNTGLAKSILGQPLVILGQRFMLYHTVPSYPLISMCGLSIESLILQ